LLRTPGRLLGRLAAVCLSALAATAVLLSVPNAAQATTYNNTDPANTPCGNGTHNVKTWHSWYIKSSGYNPLIYARLDIRYSPYCDTFWIRAVNKTGSGSGYATRTSLTSDKQAWAYYCPWVTCLANSTPIETDVLPTTGSSAWSLQLQVPNPGSINGYQQPPTLRGKVSIDITSNSSLCCELDTYMTPIWTRLENDMDNPNLDNHGNTNSSVMSCKGTSAWPCRWWGEPSGGSASVMYYLAPSLDDISNANVNIKSDFQNIFLPAWSDLQPDSPHLTSCTSATYCYWDVTVRKGTDLEMAGYLAYWVATSYNGTTYATGDIRITDPSRVGAQFDHSCGAADDGCTSPGWDDRIALSHETGHSLGLGHCPLDFGVMCHTSLTNGSSWSEGTSYWTPQGRDQDGILATYP
jgi:hypothetical protein